MALHPAALGALSALFSGIFRNIINALNRVPQQIRVFSVCCALECGNFDMHTACGAVRCSAGIRGPTPPSELPLTVSVCMYVRMYVCMCVCVWRGFDSRPRSRGCTKSGLSPVRASMPTLRPAHSTRKWEGGGGLRPLRAVTLLSAASLRRVGSFCRFGEHRGEGNITDVRHLTRTYLNPGGTSGRTPTKWD